MLIISIFSLCLVEGPHQEHAQLVEVDAPEVTHVDGTLSMLNKSRIHSSKSVRGSCLILNGWISSDKSAMASWTARFWSTTYIRLYVVYSKPMHLACTMQKAATTLPYRTFPYRWRRHCVQICMTMCILHECLSLKFRIQKGNFYNNYKISRRH